jgi:hypothetical protein
MSTNEIVELRNNQKKLKSVYLDCKPKCFGFMIKCFGAKNLNDTKMFTIFNDAVIVLFEKVKEPDFKLTCSIQVYLNSVCRNIALNMFRQEKKLFKTTDNDLANVDFDIEIKDFLEEVSAKTVYEKALEKAFSTMKAKGGNCAEILAMFWYQKATYEEIANKFSFQDSNGAKSGKAKCQKRLKDISIQFLNI